MASLPNGSFWQNGPSPGSFYNFPNTNSTSMNEPVKRSMYPVTTGTSVLGVCFNGGVALAADTLGSYGSLARFRSFSRLMKVNENTVVGGSGDIADFQYLQELLKQKVIDDACFDDNHGYTPKSIYSWLTRVLYNRRTKIDPLWNQLIVGGRYQGKNFLGYVDKLGIAYEAPTLATGYGAHIAQPILRDAFEKNPNISRQEAEKLLVTCLRVLFYRDARSLNRYEIAIVTDDEPVISEARAVDTNWDIAHFVKFMVWRAPLSYGCSWEVGRALGYRLDQLLSFVRALPPSEGMNECGTFLLENYFEWSGFKRRSHKK